LIVGESFHLAAVFADEVVMMLAVRMERLEARGAGADVDPLDEAVPGQLLENAVDAGDADSAAFGAQLVEDLLSRETTVLAAEQLDNGTPGGPFTVPSRAKRGTRGLSP
jgi:hypothetical protein